ncbi:hypothetical protein [Bradyrhizobium sp. JYMT SZCCT0428]|uniref:hypothetical protein n=1 Tax=Bradyrhizobium sp. JYMT SZCCT0428 TaxID=2807673 RepID=UPI001BA582B7|nr:hypothetical protein [Bradyrhizobium sp. JYMT SZCCT0428]MBR1151584.1 hypothetical protein [Bradyrhizobium sp. JYMT SZCCT0428]
MASRSKIPAAPAEFEGDAASSLELTKTGKFAIWFSILSTMFFSQIAINIREFPASTDLFAYGFFVIYLLATGVAHVRVVALMGFFAAAGLAAVNVSFSSELASYTSLFLLFVLYVPFHFRLKRMLNLRPVQDYVQQAFVAIAVAISVTAVVQLFAVNVLKLSFLTNISYVLPDSIRAAGIYRGDREGSGGIVKANAFFLREASTLSIVTAFAILVEYFSNARKRILAILTAGLLSSISGSGIFVILVGLAFPTSLKRVPHFLALSLLVAALIFSASEIPGLNLWVGRLSEFQIEGSSGYARYVAPFEMVQRGFDQGASAIWFGNGGGSYLRTIFLLQRKYEISDPTWAKLLYEYGVIGFLVLVLTFLTRLYSSTLRPEVCIAIFFAWISAANVLKPEFVLLVWILTLVPHRRHLKTPSRSVEGIWVAPRAA